MNDILNIIGGILNGYLHYLNWYYIIIFSIVQYGILKTDMFNWYKRLKFIPKDDNDRIWITGIIIIFIFILLIPNIEWSYNKINDIKTFIGSLLHGYTIVIVFNQVINKLVDKYTKKP